MRVVDEDVDGFLFRGDAVAEVVEGSDVVHVDLMDSDVLPPELIGPACGLLLESCAAPQGDNAGSVGQQSKSERAPEKAGGSGEDCGPAFEREERVELDVGGGDGHVCSYQYRFTKAS